MMQLPEINLRYSRIYDQRWKEVYSLKQKQQRTDPLLQSYPTSEEIIAFIDTIKPPWQKEEKKF